METNGIREGTVCDTETGLILNFSQPQLQVKRVSFIETQKLWPMVTALSFHVTYNENVV